MTDAELLDGRAVFFDCDTWLHGSSVVEPCRCGDKICVTFSPSVLSADDCDGCHGCDSTFSLADVQVSESDAPPAALTLQLEGKVQVGTGGRLWDGASQVASFIFAHRSVLHRKDILELGCGLGLPSLVAAHFAQRVVATDYLPSVLEVVRRNAFKLGSTAREALSVRQLDFLTASGMSGAGLGCWDILLFGDVIYKAELGAALPYAVRSLLRTGGIAIGAIAYGRSGLDEFWAEVPKAGLAFQKPKCWPVADDENRSGISRPAQIFLFWKRHSDPPNDNDLDSQPESVASLFHDL